MDILNEFLNIEKESNYNFCNIFIVSPGTKEFVWKLLQDSYAHNKTPQTLFIDSTYIFIKKNKNIPKENVFHTFLIDEKNNVIFVGNLHISKSLREKFVRVIKERLSNV